MGRVFRVLMLSVLALLPSAALAGEILLTLVAAGETREYDLEALQEMERATYSTTTIWTEGVQEFEGVPLAALLRSAGVTDGTLRAKAINDYAIEMPAAEALSEGPLVAYMRNGARMSVRDKGPLWIVYPYDSAPEFHTEVIYSRSIWQLDRIEIIP